MPETENSDRKLKNTQYTRIGKNFTAYTIIKLFLLLWLVGFTVTNRKNELESLVNVSIQIITKSQRHQQLCIHNCMYGQERRKKQSENEVDKAERTHKILIKTSTMSGRNNNRFSSLQEYKTTAMVNLIPIGNNNRPEQSSKVRPIKKVKATTMSQLELT